VKSLEALLREATALTRGMPSIEVSDAARMLRICNACRYCEGYCAVFPAMTRGRARWARCTAATAWCWRSPWWPHWRFFSCSRR
jgi:hypothetical protein